LLAIASAWLLVPTWATLWPPRPVTIPLLAAYLFLLMTLLAALPDRLVGRRFVALLAAAGVTTAALIAIGVSLKVGLVAVAAAAALAGCTIAAFLPRANSRFADSLALGKIVNAFWANSSFGDSPAHSHRGVIPVFVILIGGLAFVGTIEPQPPLPIILLAPAAPLALWLFAAGPLAKLQGWKAATFQIAAVLLPLIVAFAVIAIGV